MSWVLCRAVVKQFLHVMENHVVGCRAQGIIKHSMIEGADQNTVCRCSIVFLVDVDDAIRGNEVDIQFQVGLSKKKEVTVVLTVTSF